MWPMCCGNFVRNAACPMYAARREGNTIPEKLIWKQSWRHISELYNLYIRGGDELI